MFQTYFFKTYSWNVQIRIKLRFIHCMLSRNLQIPPTFFLSLLFVYAGDNLFSFPTVGSLHFC